MEVLVALTETSYNVLKTVLDDMELFNTILFKELILYENTLDNHLIRIQHNKPQRMIASLEREHFSNGVIEGDNLDVQVENLESCGLLHELSFEAIEDRREVALFISQRCEQTKSY